MKLFTLLSRILIVLCFLPAPTWAETLWQVKDVPNVQLQDATQYVTDPDSVINAEETTKLNALIAHIRKDGDQLVMHPLDDHVGDVSRLASEFGPC